MTSNYDYYIDKIINIIILFAKISFVIIIHIYLNGVKITEDSIGIQTTYGKIKKVNQPGLVIPSPFDEVKSIVVKLNTDAKMKVPCKSYDDYYVTTDIFVDNHMNCFDDDCYKQLYRDHYITDSNKYIPEDTMFFKYFPEILPATCEKLTLLQMQSAKWTTMFEEVRKNLQNKVGKNITIVSVRMTRPVTNHESDLIWVQSNIGQITNFIYRMNKIIVSKTLPNVK